MMTWKAFSSRAGRWLWVVIAMVAVVGVADAGAKEKKKSRSRADSGYIGVYMQDLTEDVRQGLDIKVKDGVLISGVAEDSPADQAGLEDGDVITSFNGTQVSTPDELRAAVRDVKPGTEAKVALTRDGKKQTLTVTVGDRPDRQFGWFSAPDAPGRPEMNRTFEFLAGGPRLGIQAHEITDGLGSYFNAKPGDGVLVLDVDDKSVAATAGVQAGDVVQKINDQKIGDVDDLRESISDFDEGDEFTITVLRHGKTQPLKATMDDQSDQQFSWVFDGRAPRADRMHRMGRVHSFSVPGPDREALREELDELREELNQLKKELKTQGD
jgi:serine protease Do